MKTFVTSTLLLAFLLMAGYAKSVSPVDTTASWLSPWLDSTTVALEALEAPLLAQRSTMRAQLIDVRSALRRPVSVAAGFRLLLEKSALEDQLDRLDAELELKQLKFRYRKGIELVKMLYEKILSMDHHFNSLKTQQNLLELSNPHHYPEFKAAGTVLEERLHKKYNFVLPQALQANPYLSSAFSLLGMVLSGSPNDKHADPEKIGCIMDFTVRMHNDLNVIYYETGYLRDANLSLKKDCELLFTDCARQVGYTIPLTNCRESDDWERLFALLDNLVTRAAAAQGAPDDRLAERTATNLQFAVERILLFVSRYTDFVNQGNEYYKKFSKIAGSYETQGVCAAVIPAEFKQLQSDIDMTIDKFNNAYKVPEIQGSKLKDMLYGNSEGY
ncbi:MAG: hypothetical protein IPL65_01060 [Lewinellaceae bacterium]|nr:hypothetical protein [Lewinellaceae bacterium]